MMAVATAFGRVLTILQIPTILAQFITSNFHSKVEILLIINVALLLIGMVMDTGPALLILAPMLIPLATELNIDVIHLGIIMVVNMAVGFVTPPFGVTLFVASPLCDTPPMRLGRKAVPFIITFLIALMFITFIPQIRLSVWPPAAAPGLPPVPMLLLPPLRWNPPPPNSMPPLICLEIIQSSPRMVLPIHCPSAMRCRNPQRATKCFWP